MRVTRKFLRDDGSPLDLDTLRQNNSFILLLEGRVEDGQDHRALVVQGLPAGWEIVGRFNDGEVPGMAWLDKLSATEAQPAADDRYAAGSRSGVRMWPVPGWPCGCAPSPRANSSFQARN